MREQWKVWCFPTNSAIALFELNFFLTTPMLISGSRMETLNTRSSSDLSFGIKLETTESTVRKLTFKDSLMNGMARIYEIIQENEFKDLVIRSIKLRTNNFEILFKSNTMKDYAKDDPYIQLIKRWEVNQKAYKRGIKVSSLDAINVIHLHRDPLSTDINRLYDEFGGFIRTYILTSTNQFRSINIK